MEHGARLSAAAPLGADAARVTSAAEAAAADHAAIALGTASFTLMQRAAAVAAAAILRDCADRLAGGVAVFAGAGNNGGDAYLVAAQLAARGVAVRLHVAAPPRSPDAQRAAVIAASIVTRGTPTGRERLAVDGLLGTGHRGALRGEVAAAVEVLRTHRESGAMVVALDLPSGLDATSGEIAAGSVPADLTLCFGTIKRGLVLQRGHVGRVLLADIGLAAPGGCDAAWRWADLPTVRRWLPPVAWDAHKGRRGRIGIVGGATGMAGAVALAARAALRAGAGVVHGIVEGPSLPPLQGLVPQALAQPWPDPDATAAPDAPAADALRLHALAVGPGLGRSRLSAWTMDTLLGRYTGTPLVLDADALWVVAEQAAARGVTPAQRLRDLTADGATLLCTPHLGEFARLTGTEVPSSWSARADVLQQFAAQANATVLLKGTPTLVATPDGAAPWVVPHGTPLLATGGSGDCLTGLVTALLGQGCPALVAAVLGATLHGRAAELATADVGRRGGTLDDLLSRLPAAWTLIERGEPRPPGILAALPAV